MVRVTDRFGNPIPNVEIAWSAEGGGEVRPATTTTGNDGRAATQRLLGEQPGTYGTTALATSLPEDVESFITTAVAAKLVLVTQPGAIASSGAIIDPQPVLRLEDPSGNPLARAGVSVTVQIASGDGSLRGGTTRLSDAEGGVTFDDLSIVGAPGARTLIFAASGYAPAISTPVSLGVGAPASVAIAAGDGQSAAVATSVATRPAVLVRDAGGTPVAGVAVTFAVASGGGSVDGGDATTGADGVATVGAWTLGGTLGSNTLTATVQADAVSGNPVTFTATATPGAPSRDRSTVSAAPGNIAASSGSVASAITVIVRDSRGNPLTGQSVSLSATGSGVTLTQPGATDASGATSARFSATGAGDHVITAETGGVTVGTATVRVTAGPVVPGKTNVTVPAGTAGSATSIDITLNDEFGNPVGGAGGQLAVAVSGANPTSSVPVEESERRTLPRAVHAHGRGHRSGRRTRGRAGGAGIALRQRGQRRAARSARDDRAGAQWVVRGSARHPGVPGRRARQSHRAGRGRHRRDGAGRHRARGRVPRRRRLSRALGSVRGRHFPDRRHARRNTDREQPVHDPDPVLLGSRLLPARQGLTLPLRGVDPPSPDGLSCCAARPGGETGRHAILRG